MKVHVFLAGSVSALLTAGAGALFSKPVAASQPSTQTASEGVYTEEQATRGKAISDTVCSQCHGGDLGGTEFGPPLVGKTFDDDFGAVTARDLFDRIQMTMPQNNPGSLPAAQAVDVIAYILKSNDFRAGETPLPSDPAALQGIKIDAKKGAKQARSVAR